MQAPINEATQSPYLSLYHYPIEGNNLIYNETHVFWPTRARLYSRFYTKITYDNQEYYGLSQQVWGENRAQAVYPDIFSSLGNNDHMYFVKAKGGIVDKNHEYITVHGFGNEKPAEIPFFDEELSQFKEKARLMFPFFLQQQKEVLDSGFYYLADHIPFMKNMANSVDPKETLREVKDTMGSFGANITLRHLYGLEKTSTGCLHMNIEGLQIIEENGRQGAWVPLDKNLLAFRAMYLMDPLVKLVIPSGILSFHIEGQKQDRSVATVFKGVQMFTSEESEDGLQLGKSRLDIFNDGRPVNDSRTSAPLNPPAFLTELIKNQSNILPINKCLPWASREKMCPWAEFESIFQKFKLNCGDLINLPEESKSKQEACRDAFVNFFPCFNYFIRPSKKCSRGMDGIGDMRTIFHTFTEVPWDILKRFAWEKPLDDDFEAALTMFEDTK